MDGDGPSYPNTPISVTGEQYFNGPPAGAYTYEPGIAKVNNPLPDSVNGHFDPGGANVDVPPVGLTDGLANPYPAN